MSEAARHHQQQLVLTHLLVPRQSLRAVHALGEHHAIELVARIAEHTELQTGVEVRVDHRTSTVSNIYGPYPI